MYSHLKKTVDHLEGYKDTEQWDVFSSRVDAGWLKLNEYYSLMDQSPAYCVALFLHPKYRFDYFEEQWADHKDWITKARTIIRETYERYEEDWLRKEKERERAIQPKEVEVELPGGTVDEGDFEAFGRVTGAAYRRKKRRIESQLDAYMDAGISDADQQVESPLYWWLTIGSAWPVLQQMALDHFSVPAMSTDCERAFSQAKRMVTEERNCLNDDTIEAEQCQKNWLLNGLV